MWKCQLFPTYAFSITDVQHKLTLNTKTLLNVLKNTDFKSTELHD